MFWPYLANGRKIGILLYILYTSVCCTCTSLLEFALGGRFGFLKYFPRFCEWASVGLWVEKVRPLSRPSTRFLYIRISKFRPEARMYFSFNLI